MPWRGRLASGPSFPWADVTVLRFPPAKAPIQPFPCPPPPDSPTARSFGAWGSRFALTASPGHTPVGVGPLAVGRMAANVQRIASTTCRSAARAPTACQRPVSVRGGTGCHWRATALASGP
jgi:hypothetical protein